MRYFTQCRSIRSPQGRKGFTLLEMAIGLVAVGMMTSIVLQNTGGGKTSDAYTKTRAQLADMQAGLDRFAKRNGYYPMPASTTPASTAVQGISVTSSGDSGITNVAADGVLIGNFPYTTLGMAASYQTDQFKNGKDSAFRYMVSTRLTTASNYKANSGKGVIAISPDKATPTSSAVAAYAIVSHGEIAGCSAPGGTAIVNCGATGTVYNFTFNKGAPGINTTVSTSSNYFDDVLVYNATNLTDCSGTVSWGNCTATIDANSPIALNQSTSITNTNPQSTGSATFSCTLAGTPQIPTLKIVGTGSCGCNAGQTLTWGSGANKCSATTSGKLASTATNDATNAANTDEVLTSTGTTGTATARCVNGALVIAQESSATCGSATSCDGGTISWDGAGNITRDTAGPCSGILLKTSINNNDGTWAFNQNYVINYGPTGFISDPENSIAVTCKAGTLIASNPNTSKCQSAYTGYWVEGDCSATSCSDPAGGTTGAPYCTDGGWDSTTNAATKIADANCDPTQKPVQGQSCQTQDDCTPCSLPWGGTLAAGQSVKAYYVPTTSSPPQCKSTMLTCTDGDLFGPNRDYWGVRDYWGNLQYTRATPDSAVCASNSCFTQVPLDLSNADMSTSVSSSSYVVSGTTYGGTYFSMGLVLDNTKIPTCDIEEREFFIDIPDISKLGAVVNLGNAVQSNVLLLVTVNGNRAWSGPYSNTTNPIYLMDQVFRYNPDGSPVKDCWTGLGNNYDYCPVGVRLNNVSGIYGTPVQNLTNGASGVAGPPAGLGTVGSPRPSSWGGCNLFANWQTSTGVATPVVTSWTVYNVYNWFSYPNVTMPANMVNIKPLLQNGRNSIKLKVVAGGYLQTRASVRLDFPLSCSQ